jgi:hypothetical protein
MEQEISAVQLQAPGAGLPALEQQIMGKLLRFSACYLSTRRALAMFSREADLIVKYAAGLRPVDGARQVLVKRVRGMEDSSRHWSAYMVLEHLAIVNTGVTGMVRTLVAGQTVNRQVRIQDVKPRPGAGPEQIERFKQSVATYVQVIDTLPDLRTQARHLHPWFGPLDAQGWHMLGALHHRVHRKQLRRILAGL